MSGIETRASKLRHEVSGLVWIVGRAADCDIVIDDDYVSPYHARVVRDGDRVTVQDLGATNPVLVHGLVKAYKPLSVPVGGRVQIGRTDMWRTS